MTEPELLWVAGLLEGEGSFLISGKRYHRGQPKVSMGSVDRDVIDRIHALTGEVGGVYEKTKRTKGGKRFFLWSINRQDDAVALMKQLRPHMSSRRQGQIDECLAHYKTRPIGMNNPAVCPPGLKGCYICKQYKNPDQFSPQNTRCRKCNAKLMRERRIKKDENRGLTV